MRTIEEQEAIKIRYNQLIEELAEMPETELISFCFDPTDTRTKQTIRTVLEFKRSNNIGQETKHKGTEENIATGPKLSKKLN